MTMPKPKTQIGNGVIAVTQSRSHHRLSSHSNRRDETTLGQMSQQATAPLVQFAKYFHWWFLRRVLYCFYSIYLLFSSSRFLIVVHFYTFFVLIYNLLDT